MEFEVECTSPNQENQLHPKGVCELNFRYTNLDDVTHHVAAVYLAPTWNLNSPNSYDDLEYEITPSETIHIGPIEAKIPEKIFGRQGFRIGFKITEVTDGGQSIESGEYATVWADTIERWDVEGTNLESSRALVCVAGGSGHYRPINRLLKDYGCNTDFVESFEELNEKCKTQSDDVTLVCGVLLPGGLEEDHSHLIASMLPYADTRDEIEELDRTAIGSLIVQHSATESVTWASNAHAHRKIDAYDRLELERAIGNDLYKLIIANDGGLLHHFDELARELKTTPRDIIDSVSTDAIIAAFAMGAEAQYSILKRAIETGGLPEVGGTAAGENHQPKQSPKPDVLEFFDEEGPGGLVRSERLDELVQLLVNDNTSIRREAADALAKVAGAGYPTQVVEAGALQPLTDCLNDEDKEVRSNSAGALGGFSVLYHNDQNKGSKHDGPGQTSWIYKQVVEVGAIQPLIDCLDDGYEEVRRNSATALKELSREHPEQVVKDGALQPLIDCLDDEDKWVRRNSATALGELAREHPKQVVKARALQPLIDSLDDEDKRVRRNSATALGELAREHPKQVVKARALQALTDCLDDEDKRVSKSAVALRHVAEKYPKQVVKAGALQPLTDSLDDEDSWIRSGSAGALGQVAEKYPKQVVKAGALQPLTDGLDDEYEWVRSKSAGALEQVAKKYPKQVVKAGALQPLIDCLDDEDKRGRSKCAGALEQVAKKYPKQVVKAGALQPLTDGLDDEYEWVRSKSAGALEQVAKKYPKQVVKAGALQPLTDGLDDEYEWVRSKSAGALGQVAKKYPKQVVKAGALQPLIDCLDDEDKMVRALSAVTLARVGKVYPKPVLQTRASDSGTSLDKLATLANEDTQAGRAAQLTLREISRYYPTRVKKAKRRNRGWF